MNKPSVHHNILCLETNCSFLKFFRYPNISCELLTSDVSQINDRLGEDENLLMKLYGFLKNNPPLNPLLASFFSKVLSILIGRKPDQVSLKSHINRITETPKCLNY